MADIKSANAYQIYRDLEHGGDDSAAVKHLAFEYGISHKQKPKKDGNFPCSEDADTLLGISKVCEPTGHKKGLLIRKSTIRNPAIIEPEAIIEGLLRRGEIANLIASPKMRKSWSIHDLAYCCANGETWLGRFKCKPSKVLLIDNELREWQLAKRFETMQNERGKKDSITPFDYVALKDDGIIDINELCQRILDNEQQYDFIILDALYRLFPPGPFGAITKSSG